MDKIFAHEIFTAFRDYIHDNYGIYYADSKKELLKLKLDRCLKNSNSLSYEQYYKLISSQKDSTHLKDFIDEITVNKTDFFRETEHFDFIKSKMDFICENNSRIMKNREIRVWSAACSTGQEPHTTAMVLKETLPMDFKIKILATDISNKVLKVASNGEYPEEIKNEIDPYYLNKYFTNTGEVYKVKKEIMQLITFRRFNLMNEFPFSGLFDIVFCRNVMIYFNLETQKQLLEKIYNCLHPGGILIIGKSESLMNKHHKFKRIISTIYTK